MPNPTSRAHTDMTHEDAILTMASERYLLDEMDDEERERFEAHYFACAVCAEDMRTASLVADEVRAGAAGRPLDEAAPTARRGTVLRPSRWKRAVAVPGALPWAVAASLAVVVGYQTVAPDGRQAIEPQAVNPVVLRGATRGALPEVVVTTGQDVVALSFDTFAEPDTVDLAFDLLGPSGNALLSGRAPVPTAGVPLLLLVPSDRLAGSGRHTLVVRDADRPERTVGEYAFTVSR